MLIEMQSGEKLVVKFEGEQGEVTIHFDTNEYTNSIAIHAEPADSAGDCGTLYYRNLG